MRVSRRPVTIGLTLVGLSMAACAPADDGIERGEGTVGLRGLALDDTFEAASFVLEDTEGQAFDFREETAGDLTLLFFGYTHCPDICPVQMAVLDGALEDLAYRDRAEIQVVFVTTDPVRDTPEQLRTWLDRFDPGFVGLVGDLDRINEIQATFRLPEAVIDTTVTTEASGYFVGHATPLLAITGDGVVQAFYPSGVRQTDWRHDLPLLLEMNRAVADGPAGAPNTEPAG